MSPNFTDKKRKRGSGPSRTKKQRRIDAYHSSSSEDESEDDTGVQLPNLQNDDEVAEGSQSDDEPLGGQDTATEDGEEDEDDEAAEDEDEEESDADTTTTAENGTRKLKKRNDPTAFATSLSKILTSKLTGTQRADPILSRSAAASSNAKELADSKLEAKAKRKMRDEKKALKDRGHVTDVLGVETMDVEAAMVAEEEKRLRKTAQRGVVKLFNAVRAAQVQAEEAAKEAREGTSGIGLQKKQERVNEMSKKGFLELLSGETAEE